MLMTRRGGSDSDLDHRGAWAPPAPGATGSIFPGPEPRRARARLARVPTCKCAARAGGRELVRGPDLDGPLRVDRQPVQRARRVRRRRGVPCARSGSRRGPTYGRVLGSGRRRHRANVLSKDATFLRVSQARCEPDLRGPRGRLRTPGPCPGGRYAIAWTDARRAGRAQDARVPGSDDHRPQAPTSPAHDARPSAAGPPRSPSRPIRSAPSPSPDSGVSFALGAGRDLDGPAGREQDHRRHDTHDVSITPDDRLASCAVTTAPSWASSISTARRTAITLSGP